MEGAGEDEAEADLQPPTKPRWNTEVRPDGISAYDEINFAVRVWRRLRGHELVRPSHSSLRVGYFKALVVRKIALQQAPVVEQFDRDKVIPSLERGECRLGIQFLGRVPESEANFWVFVGGARVSFPADHVGWVALAPGKYSVCFIRSGAIKMAVATLIPGEALLIGFRFYGSISFSKWDGSRALDPQDFAVTNRRSLENQ